MAKAEPVTRDLAIELIDPSPTNTRQTMDEKKLAELADSIRKHGVLQPICVRPHPRESDKFDVVFGHRRLEAALMAGLRSIPAMIRNLDDRASLEAQVLENLQREDVPPVEEAEGLRRLHEDHGYAVDELASRLGRTKAYVYSRLTLCSLPPRGREALAHGELTLSAALLVARIPNADLREEAIKELVRGGDFLAGELEPASAADARELIEERFIRRLEGAPFDIAAESVVPGVGACSTCPRRTGNQRELFADAKSPDICTDPPCFRAKVDAAWNKRAAEARAQGRKVASAEETKKLFPYPNPKYIGDSSYVDLDDKNWDAPKNKTWRQCLGKRAAEVVTLVRDPTGDIREVAKKDQVVRICREAGQAWAQKRPGTAPAPKSDAQKQADQRRRIHVEALREAVSLLVEEAEMRVPDDAFWRLLAHLAVRVSWSDTQRATASRRGLLQGKTEPSKLLDSAIESMTGARARGLAVELLATKGAFAAGYGTTTPPDLEDAFEYFGVDLKGLEARAKKAAEPKKPAKTPKEKRAAGAKTRASASAVED
jgi:ParB/RepB/Spo0J family partition protein